MYGKGPGSCLGHVSDKKKKKKDNNKKTVHTCDALRVVVVNKCIADIKLPVSGILINYPLRKIMKHLKIFFFFFNIC